MKTRISNEQVNNNKYIITNLQYFHSNGQKTMVTYEKNGIKKEIELNGLLNKETALHVLQKRNF